MFDVLYFYPTSSGATSEVGRHLFSALQKRKLFFNIELFPQYGEDIIYLKNKYPNLGFASLRDLCNFKNYQLVHFTVEPVIWPNRKFLMYLISIFKKIFTKKCRIIVNFHGDPRSEFMIKFNNKEYLRCLTQVLNFILTPSIIKSADVVVVNSHSMENLFKAKYKTNNILVIPNGIDSSWKFKSKSLNLNHEDVINLFFHGRIGPEKGVDLLIKAFSDIVIEGYTRVNLYLAGPEGDRKYSKSIKDLCNELSIDQNVTFLGLLPLPLLKSYLSSVDAAIYPSIYEPFSIAILEAFTTVNGPVLYSERSGINDFVLEEGYQFYTFSPSVEEIKNSIRMLLEGKYDRNVSSKQKEFASFYTWDNISDRYVNLYQMLFKQFND